MKRLTKENASGISTIECIEHPEWGVKDSTTIAKYFLEVSLVVLTEKDAIVCFCLNLIFSDGE